jgi:hypothetical protein
MPVELGGSKAWRVKPAKGGLVLSYQWLDKKPAMFVFRANKTREDGAFVLPLASAYLWAKPNGYPDLDHAIPTALAAAQQIGLGRDRWAVRAIIDAVLDGIPDLIAMPPEPKWLNVAPNTGELTIKRDGEVVSERVIQ